MKKRAKQTPKAADIQFRKRRRRRKAAKAEADRAARARKVADDPRLKGKTP